MWQRTSTLTRGYFGCALVKHAGDSREAQVATAGRAGMVGQQTGDPASRAAADPGPRA